MNRLSLQTSPYLLQHAHNPVDWYPWGEEAFARAREEDKPVLVSIGYSACHWCHVMERESFENAEVAAFMNSHFINIKVDREERPDVDQVYMEAVQALSGSGGWPLNCFLLADGRPFYGGTYFPPQPAYNRPSWLQVLQNISAAHRDKRPVVEDQADRLTRLISQGDQVFLGKGMQEDRLIDPEAVFDTLSGQFDREHGGFGSAPKFPGTMALSFLLQYHYIYASQAALDHVLLSLSKMVQGGIYDQLGGGLARYSVDAAWFAPHFEKMLYDNALFASLLIDSYQHSGQSWLLEAARETLDFVQEELLSPEGGFYAALDADSEGEEGKYYTWQAGELEALLGTESEWFFEYYGVEPGGNWEHSNILHRRQEAAAFAIERGWEPQAFARQLQAAKEKLLAVRKQRIRPGLDDKCILGWNALMSHAFLRMYAATQERHYLEIARRNLDFLQQALRMKDGRGLLHCRAKGRNADIPAFLEDYAFLIRALIEAHQATQDIRYLSQAQEWIAFVEAHFCDPERGLFYFAPDFQDDLPARKLDLMDNATPSGNAMLCGAYIRLSALSGESSQARQAESMLRQVQDTLRKYPSSFAQWAQEGLLLEQGMATLAILGAEALPWGEEIRRGYDPFTLVAASARGDQELELFKNRYIQGQTLLYRCQGQTCEAPMSRDAFTLRGAR